MIRTVGSEGLGTETRTETGLKPGKSRFISVTTSVCRRMSGWYLGVESLCLSNGPRVQHSRVDECPLSQEEDGIPETDQRRRTTRASGSRAHKEVQTRLYRGRVPSGDTGGGHSHVGSVDGKRRGGVEVTIVIDHITGRMEKRMSRGRSTTRVLPVLRTHKTSENRRVKATRGHISSKSL